MLILVFTGLRKFVLLPAKTRPIGTIREISGRTLYGVSV
jgi:hypothetical protein